MATVQCSKCTAERKGFRRELDSWRHKLIHCVGMIHVQFHILYIKKSTSFEPFSPGNRVIATQSYVRLLANAS